MRVSVIGGSTIDDQTYDVAYEVGQTLANRGHTVVCGGLTGAMEAVSKGASEAGGQTIGVLPTDDPSNANDYIDIPVATGLGNARNVIVVLNGDAAIAIDGAYGTLSEIAFALDSDMPVAGLDTHNVSGVTPVESPSEAVNTIEHEVNNST